MTVTSPRIFIADFDLVGYSGHYFNQVFGFCRAARELGLETRVYVSEAADPKITAELDACGILPPVHWYTQKDALLNAFAGIWHLLRPLSKDIEEAGVSKQDILVVTSARPQVILGIGQWLGTLPEEMRPAIFFRFHRTDFFDFKAMAFSNEAWAYRFAIRMLANISGKDRLFLTVNNDKAVAHLERLTLRSAFFLPVPKYYGAVADSPRTQINEPTKIYVHVNRPGDMPGLVSRVLKTILERRRDVTFVVRFCRYVFPAGITPEADFRKIFGSDVTFFPSAQGADEYLAEIKQADMVLLPYDPVEYLDIISGIFCEVAAMGKVAIIPDGTWMADQVIETRATGVLFSENSVNAIVAAIESALESRVRLQAEAIDRAGLFREQYSCARNLDRMLQLAGQTHDMRLSYVPLTDATTLLGSRQYLGEGWCETEEGYGVWSDGDIAYINFSIKPGGKTLFFNVQLRPFLARAHSHIDVSLTANNVPVVEWSFDANHPSSRNWSWHHARIPEDVADSGEIRLVLSIRSPVSPKELGLSVDYRKLGIALRQFSLESEMRSSMAQPLEKLSGLRRLHERIRRTWRQASPSSE
jgi:hypothetical protein